MITIFGHEFCYQPLVLATLFLIREKYFGY